MNIPINDTNIPTITKPLAKLYGLEEDKKWSRSPSTLRYSINPTAKRLLNINPQTGDLFLTKEFFEANNVTG